MSLVRYQVIHRDPAAREEEILDAFDGDTAQVFLVAEGRADFHDGTIKRDGEPVCRLSAFRTDNGRYWMITPVSAKDRVAHSASAHPETPFTVRQGPKHGLF